MAFFQRVLSYVANELLVNRLANKCGAVRAMRRPRAPRTAANARRRRSPTFQRFAIRSDAMARELQQQGAAKQAELLSKSRELARELQQQAAKAVEEASTKKL